MDLYIPRKCSWTNKLITAKDHGAVQLNIGHLDESGVYSGSFSTFALCGQLRSKVRSAAVLSRGAPFLPDAARRLEGHSRPQHGAWWGAASRCTSCLAAPIAELLFLPFPPPGAAG